jgi:hypothetical protein
MVQDVTDCLDEARHLLDSTSSVRLSKLLVLPVTIHSKHAQQILGVSRTHVAVSRTIERSVPPPCLSTGTRRAMWGRCSSCGGPVSGIFHDIVCDAVGPKHSAPRCFDFSQIVTTQAPSPTDDCDLYGEKDRHWYPRRSGLDKSSSLSMPTVFF